MSDKKLVIGIDGGGTKTTCVLFDAQGNTLDAIHGNGSNLYVYKKESIIIILGLIHSILERKELNLEDVDAFGIAAAGISDLNQRELLLKELDRINITKKTNLFCSKYSDFSCINRNLFFFLCY